jgi:beta-glucanase (GH16 family)
MNGVKQLGLLVFLLPFGFLLNGCQGHASDQVYSATDSRRNWVLTWDDEFSGPNGSSPDPAKWIVESGGNGWGNGELEYYTPRPENLRLENGNLVIEAVKEEFAGSEGVKRRYTSGRLKTQGRFSQAYGRFEARIQIPSGQGVWPAFWLLGDNYPTASWPVCGEIDVMENVDVDKSKIHGSIHGPGYSAKKSLTSSYALANWQFSDDFHVFAVEWEPQVIRFYVDDKLYATRSPADLPKGAKWVFDHPFFLILNLAVGGNLPASPDISTDFPQRMLVDYVRVYSRR